MKHTGMGLLLVIALAGCTQSTPPETAPAAQNAPDKAAETAAPAVAAKDDFPQVLQASGTEPFWGVRVDGAALDYTTPETQDTPRHFEGTRELRDGLLVVHGGQGDDAFQLTLERAECSDGMSDLSHPFTAEFVLGKDTWKGCARDPAVATEKP